jgi:hypothetical protein
MNWSRFFLTVKSFLKLRRLYGTKKDEVTGDWKMLHNEGLHNVCSSRDIIRMIKSRRMRWAGHAAR